MASHSMAFQIRTFRNKQYSLDRSKIYLHILTMQSSTRNTLIGSLFAIAAISSWAIYFPFAKIILLKVSPSVFIIFRFTIGALTLFALNKRLKRSFYIAKKDLFNVAAAAFVGLILHQFVQVSGLVYTSATNTGWLLTLIPVFTGLLAWLFLKEKVSWRQIAGLVIAMAGVIFFISDGYLSELSFLKHKGDFLVLASALTWSFYTVITKSRLDRYDPLPISTIHMAIGAVVFLLVAGWKLPDEVAVLDWQEWIIVILIGVIPSGLAYFWWNAALKKLTSLNTGMFLFLEAVMASVSGALILNESFTISMAGFAVIIIVGVYIAQSRGE